jgi:hypothetical protein
MCLSIGSIQNCADGRDVLIVAAGSSVLKYENQIKDFIRKNEPITIGINKMTHFIIPDYHLWTNNQRLTDQGGCIKPQSQLLIGSHIRDESIRKWKHLFHDFILIPYNDTKTLPFRYDGFFLEGYFRTAGCLAIGVAHVMQADNIYIVGMDGFTLYSQADLANKIKSQHCYGKGHTDDYGWRESIEKDVEINNALNGLSGSLYFKILTPTKYSKFYDGDVLKEYEND